MFKKINKKILSVILSFAFFASSVLPVFGQVMESSLYRMDSDSINIGGARASSGLFIEESTLGEIATGRTNGALYYMRAGYQERIDGTTTGGGTTPTETAPATTVVAGGNGPVFLNNFDIRDISVNVKGDIAIVSWTTTRSAKSAIVWGEKNEGEEMKMTELANDNLLLRHEFVLAGIILGKTYTYSILSDDGRGTKAGLSGQTFYAPLPKEIPIIDEENIPENVLELSAKSEDGKIVLDWKNPKGAESVRVMRQENSYPTDPYHGEILYEGNGETAVDEKTENGKTYYYTVFVKDSFGEFSSGSIISAKKTADGKIIFDGEDPFSKLPESEKVHPKIAKLALDDFIFMQDGKRFSPKNGTIKISGAKNFSLIIPYEILPEVLKTISVNLKDKKTNESFTFLMRVNKDKTAYVATLGSLDRDGEFDLSVSVLDYGAQGIKRLSGTLIASPFDTASVFKKFLPYLGIIIILFAIAKLLKKYIDKKTANAV